MDTPGNDQTPGKGQEPQMAEGQAREGSVTWKIIEYVFDKPFLAASAVGFGIHILLAVNEFITIRGNYITDLGQDFVTNYIYATFKILIPFLIPFAITSIGKMITTRSNKTSLTYFPEANPDIVMKLSHSGEPIYINRSAKGMMECTGVSGPEALLPENYREMIQDIVPGTPHGPIRKTIGQTELAYTFNCFPDELAYFVSGRDITQKARLEDALAHAHESFTNMVDFLDEKLDTFEEETFRFDAHTMEMMDHLLDDGTGSGPHRATHIFMAERDSAGSLKGHIYKKEAGRVVGLPELIEIDPSQDRVAITLGEKDVVLSNWEDSGSTLEEYQRGFHHMVRQRVGTIERFITYRSGDVAILAFFKGRRVDDFDARELKGLSVFSNSLKRISDKVEETRNAFRYTVDALARAAEANDEDTGEHIVRVNDYSHAIAEVLGLEQSFIDDMHYSAQMHDVGKVHVHPDILRKKGPLTGPERKEMMMHPEYGARILGESPRLALAAEIALTHHENFTGGGYPGDLKGNGIPISGRIVKVADIYDALRQARSYKPAFSHERAMEIITRGDHITNPSDFDPEVLAAFVSIEREISRIYDDSLLREKSWAAK